MIRHSTLQNDLQVVTEYVQSVSIVAMHWGIPAGIATNRHDGDSVILSELVQRGARGLSARNHNDALEMLGVQKRISCGNEFIFVSGAMLQKAFGEGFELLSGYILDPLLPEGDLPACKQLCTQALSALADDPSSRVGIAVNLYHHPVPFNRSGLGDPSVIKNASIADLQHVLENRFLPKGSIVAISGNLTHDEVVATIESATSEWAGTPANVEESTPPVRGLHWIQHDSSQVHICIAIDAPNANDEHSICESIATVAFGGATSGRLFTQVRQRKSLVYSVGAQYGASKDRSVMRIHAGTTPSNAVETIEVCLDELEKMKRGITQHEFDRVVRRMKSRVVMHGESTAARASALWSDQFALSKAKSLQDRLDEMNEVTLERVNGWLESRTFGKLTLVTLGPEEIQVDSGRLLQH